MDIWGATSNKKVDRFYYNIKLIAVKLIMRPAKAIKDVLLANKMVYEELPIFCLKVFNCMISRDKFVCIKRMLFNQVVWQFTKLLYHT